MILKAFFIILGLNYTMKNRNFSEMTLKEILEYEKASSIVCMKYENSCKSYDGSISNGDEYTLFLKYNKIHEDLILELQKRLDVFAE